MTSEEIIRPTLKEVVGSVPTEPDEREDHIVTITHKWLHVCVEDRQAWVVLLPGSRCPECRWPAPTGYVRDVS